MRGKKETIILSDRENKDQQGILSTMFEFIIALLFLSSVYLAFFACINDELCQMIVALEAVILLSILSILKLFPNIYQYFVVLGSVGIFAALIGLYHSIIRGFIDFINQLILLWDHRFRMYQDTFANDGFMQTDRMIFWIFLTLCLTIFIGNIVYRKNYYVMGFVSFFILFFTFSFGLTMYGIPMVLFVSGWLTCWSYRLSKSRKSRLNIITLFVFTAIFLGVGIFATLQYKPISAVSHIKSVFISNVNQLRYGTDTLPEGNTLHSNQLNQGNEKRLDLKVTEVPKNIYLKGYVGSNYKNNQWNLLHTSAYLNNEGMLSWLKENGIDVTNQYREFKKIDANSRQKIISLKTMKVTNVGASRKYLYLPNTYSNIKSNEKYVANSDWQIISDEFLGTKSYSYSYVNENIQSELVVTPKWLTESNISNKGQYIHAEAVYRNFVYKNYLSVDANSKKILNQGLSLDISANDNIYEATKKIRKALEGVGTVSDTMNLTETTKDFLNEFLINQKTGNSVAYATAATLAYRTAGIPARYVEGYYYKGNEKSKAKKVSLTSKDAHAWVEVYFDGIGWMPIEVTPGFYQSDYSIKKDNEEQSKEKHDDENKKDSKADDSVTDKPKDKNVKDEAGPIYGVNQYLALVVIMLYLIFFVFVLLELQRFLRLKYRQGKQGMLQTKDEARYFFHRTCKILKKHGLVIDESKPYENINEKDGMNVNIENYKRFVGVLQQCIFGEQPLGKSERRIVTYFYNKHKNMLYLKGNIFKKLKYRYFNCY